MSLSKLQPVVLCGGSGTRLWPLSRESFPKQFLSIESNNGKSLLQKTVLRLKNIGEINAPIIICNNSCRFIVAEQLRELNITPKAIILEPEGRGTAPAIAIATLLEQQNSDDSLLLIVSSDHEISNIKKFSESIRAGIKYAKEGRLVTFGVIPDSPETGYGYIESIKPLNNKSYLGSEISKFIEKPNLKDAKYMIQKGNFTWNSGIFLFKSKTIFEELKKFEPKIINHCNTALNKSKSDLDFERIEDNSFLKCPNISIDIAVMEKTSLGTVIPLDAGWSDIGSWDRVWDISNKNSSGNSFFGNIILKKSKNCLIRGSERLIVGIGLNNLTIIDTDDAILIINKKQSQSVKKIVQELKKANKSEAITHKKIYRPWGNYRTIVEDLNWQVKKIIVKPNHSLSLQMHNFRSEHWVIVSGKAKVEINEKIKILSKNESAYIPLKAKHRLSNPFNEELILIEVQSGERLIEEDIIRFEDSYGRVSFNKA